MDPTCLACGRPAPGRLATREMMFALGTPYTYARCDDCGALTLVDPPDDLAPHYPPGYYSLDADRQPPHRPLSRALRRPFLRLSLRLGRPVSGRPLLRTGIRPPAWLLATRTRATAPILDVGCGAGHLLAGLYNEGFTDLLGVDPFRDDDEVLADGLRLRRQSIDDVDGRFALVMWHHVLEHLRDPLAALVRSRALLAPGGALVVRVPLADGEAARRYGGDWIQLDPPRHLWIPTRDGMAALARRAGLRRIADGDDSTAFQFWGSEQARLGIPLQDPRSVAVDPAASPLADRLDGWAVEAAALAAGRRGDQGWFVYRAE